MRPLGLSLTYQSAFCSFSDSLTCRQVYGSAISSSAMEIFQPLGVSDVSSSIMERQPLQAAASIVTRRGGSAFHLGGTKTRLTVPFASPSVVSRFTSGGLWAERVREHRSGDEGASD